MKRLAVVIVNYRIAKLTRACVESLFERVDPQSVAFKAFVVDNDSQDGSFELLSAAFEDRPQVEVVRAPRNGGYAAGNNLVLRDLFESADDYDFVWLLNPDTAVVTKVDEAALAFLERPHVAAMGARLEYVDATPQTSVFRFPSPFSEFLQAANLGLLNRVFARFRVVQPIPDVRTRADWLAGASVVFRMDALREAGLFDETFFLYYEEVDLFKRLAEAGWESWHCPEMRVIHHVGAATGISNERSGVGDMPDYWYASRSHYFQKRYGLIGALGVDLCWLLGRSLFLFSRFVLGRRDTMVVKYSRIRAHHPITRSSSGSGSPQGG